MIFSGYKATGRLKFGIILKIGTIPLQQTWKKPYDEGYFFEIQSLEEMHALNGYLPISKCF